MKNHMCKIALAAIFALGANHAVAEDFAIMNGTVHTVAGAVIENGDVIISDGRITAVGADLTAPTGATVIDAAGKVVTPGLFAPFSDIGLKEISLDAEGNDAAPDAATGFRLGAALNALDAYNPATTLIAVNRAGGVTRALSAPGFGATLFGGQAAVIDLSGRVDSVTKPGAAQVAVMGYGGAARNGDTRMGSWAVLREYLDEAQIYASAPNAYAARAREDRFAIADLKALGPVLDGQQPLIVAINGANEIRNLIRLKNKYRINIIIVGGAEAWRMARPLAAANIPVILDPNANLPESFDALGSTLENAARLHQAGVLIGFFNPEGSGAHNLRGLTQLAGNAVAAGLPHDAALAALTVNPARMFGLAETLGALEPGKIADIVIWSGDPLEVTSQADAVFINGERQDLNNRQRMLAERYKDLSRGDLPHAYRGAPAQ